MNPTAMIAASAPPAPKYRYSAGRPFCSVESGAEVDGAGDCVSLGGVVCVGLSVGLTMADGEVVVYVVGVWVGSGEGEVSIWVIVCSESSITVQVEK